MTLKAFCWLCQLYIEFIFDYPFHLKKFRYLDFKWPELLHWNRKYLFVWKKKLEVGKNIEWKPIKKSFRGKEKWNVRRSPFFIRCCTKQSKQFVLSFAIRHTLAKKKMCFIFRVSSCQQFKTFQFGFLEYFIRSFVLFVFQIVLILLLRLLSVKDVIWMQKIPIILNVYM